MKKWSYIIACVTTIIGGTFIYLSKDFPQKAGNAPGPGLWPGLLGAVLIGLSLILVISTLTTKKTSMMENMVLLTVPIKRVYKLMGITIAFTVILYFFGFVIATLLFIPAVMYLLEVRSLKYMVTTSLLVTTFIYVVFVLILNIPLPKPIFFR
ncbi:Tripartite tricarboxylate transporter TctB family protein [Anaerovirgula multivorans]|uniref:Tripartite tricarboxylate transporter TctB family protein n=1 Tax=Anaerovirgula multivorans TaxID=312168 RepID=A0A239AZ46_9FIRM|nr:tripartite tricarboxylate transporter TctB family protein [Anaerovirgula multivorans]SNS00238.1 Tripartite tricarboxylate transporter TctB family protein [Anaerovirgula multivorans]